MLSGTNIYLGTQAYRWAIQLLSPGFAIKIGQQLAQRLSLFVDKDSTNNFSPYIKSKTNPSV